MQTKFQETSHGTIAYWETGGAGAPVLFVHGNSSSKRIFEKQMDSPLAETHRLIAFDLPGHGESDRAINPQSTYYIAGFADALMEAADGLGLTNAVVVGWSLGGHIALEMLARWEGAKAAMIFGAPPIPNDAERAMSAFLPSDHMHLTFQETWSEEDAALSAAHNFADSSLVEPWMLEDAARCDGRFRPLMFQASMEGRNLDEEELVGTCEKPLAVLQGEKEAYVSMEFLNSVAFRNLWRGQIQMLPGLGHTPQFEDAARFNSMLRAFLSDVG